MPKAPTETMRALAQESAEKLRLKAQVSSYIAKAEAFPQPEGAEAARKLAEDSASIPARILNTNKFRK